MEASARLGQPHAPIDGPAKVCGVAAYPGDEYPERVAYGVLVTSAIARGRITALDDRATRASPGVLDVLSWRNVGDAVRPVGYTLDKDGWANSTHRPLSGPDIRYGGQILAVVIGNTLEAAQAGAAQVRVTYAAEPSFTTIDAAAATAEPLAGRKQDYNDRHTGDVAASQH